MLRQGFLKIARCRPPSPGLGVRLSFSSSQVVLPASRATKIASLLTGIALYGYVYIAADDKRHRDAARVATSVYRMASLVGTVALICTDYGLVFYSLKGFVTEQEAAAAEMQAVKDEMEGLVSQRAGGDSSSSLLERIQNASAREKIAMNRLTALMATRDTSPYHDVHLRSALRLKALCERNKGVYIKLGQHLGQLDYLLPPEYIDTFKTMFSDNPTSSFDSVVRVIEEETGLNIHQLFTEFESRPIASASLAQVHMATGSDGRKYAIKVQHEGLLEASYADLLAITTVASIVSYMFENFDYEWLVKEINYNLPRELDFTLEANNARRATTMLRSDDVVIPQIYISTPRVLCMSFEEGCYVTNAEELNRLNIRGSDVAKLISETFSEQM